jgi:hypothetical protein
VLDVPAESERLAFGVLLAGEGRVWLDDVRLDAVGLDVATTGMDPCDLEPSPRNLSFED